MEGIETNSVKIKKISQNSQENTITLNSAAGIITASTLALATTEVMGLTTFTDVTSNQNIDGNDDILDFSKITDSLVIDLDLKSFQQLSSGLQFNFDGYENIVGGSDIDQISRVVSSQDIIGIVGGKGNDQITGLNQDILRYDLEEKYRDNNDAVNGVNVDLLNQIALDTYGNSDQISGIDNVYGTSYDDLLKGNENGNTLFGYSGNDILKGYGGNDVIVGGSGADIIDGGAGNDLLTGDDGYYQNADLFIFKGASENLSDFGDDIVTDFDVGLDKARIYLSNSDQLTGQESLTGTTVSTGQASVDFQWSRYEQLDKYDDLMDAVQEIRVLSNNLVNLDGQKAAKAGEDDVLQLTKLGSEDANGYLIDVAFEQMLSINDSSESYQLFGMQNYDIFLGSSGKDILIGSGETTSGFAGGKGDDVIYGSSLDYLAYDMEEELITEEIIGSELNKINNHVKVNLGDDSVDLNGIFVDARTAEDIWGSNDELIGIENVNATSGNDYVFGSDNSNTIVTGEGNDFIYGGKGNDILDGGSGSDKFVFLQSDLEASNDQDTILNFNKDEDTLTFDTLGMEDVSVSFIDDTDGSAADTIISFDNNPDWGSIILVDVGRLDKDELNIDTDATVGGLG